jgi:hypothetical protein
MTGATAAGGGTTSSPLLSSIHTACTPLACSAARSAASVSTNLVFQKGWDSHAPSRDWRYMPSLTSFVAIFFSITASSM